MITAYEAMKRSRDKDIKDEEIIMARIEQHILKAIKNGKQSVKFKGYQLLSDTILLSRDVELQSDFVLKMKDLLILCGYDLSIDKDDFVTISWNNAISLRHISGVENNE